MTKTTFCIVRHGQTNWNAEKRIQGQADIPLNEAGRAEAAKLASLLDHMQFAKCFSSDLKRASETAQILRDTLSSKISISHDKRLRERNFGHWEGHLQSEFYANPENRKDIESNESMNQRVFQVLQEIASKHRDDNILIVTHGGIIRNLIIKINGLNCSVDDIETKNTAILKIEYDKDKWSISEMQGITVM